jgi:hypothetical protein
MLTNRRRVVVALLGFGGAVYITAFTAAGVVTHAARWTAPRTPWGDPDFQGATWDFSTMTPLERPAGIEHPVLTEVEAAAFEPATLERQKANNTNGPDWWDDGSRHLDHRRTSLIIDPADGRLPALTPEAAQRSAALRQAARRPAEGADAFPLNTRCIGFVSTGPPMIPAPYNDNVLFFQTRDQVAIWNENIHDTRVVPLTGRPHGTIRQWLGDGRGHWDKDTLVVDTTNFSTKTNVRGSDENLHIVERFKRVDADTIEYQFTADDPTVWVRPWTALLSLRRTRNSTFEFACHEGNSRSMEGLLRAARLLDSAKNEGLP